MAQIDEGAEASARFNNVVTATGGEKPHTPLSHSESLLPLVLSVTNANTDFRSLRGLSERVAS